jgi:hypothetical protein
MGPPGSLPGLDDVPFGGAVGVGFELEHIGLQDEHFEELVHALTGAGGAIDEDGVTAPFFGGEPFILELLPCPHGVGGGVVAFVDGDHNRDLGGQGVAEGLEGLGHHAVVGGDHQHHDIRHVGAAGAHGGEGGVARRVEEGDLLKFLFALGMRDGNRVGADMLGDAAGFAWRRRWTCG